ncbi:electron transfer flavoprotein subunit alpha/FixB family protein [Haloferax sp. AB510]|uniref:electron transfer flavoprotein subunit alpha/FixB family protein n=1 Tax=Haloferax sp. AB510 TaxID=2934172 RepID=UPI00209BC88A|nr:electron transfer flavoprotein subunit alpha/FixB family protein [Haloferax sp. AB510]MCO8265413.1 electron transfer flavoprotein subunit alpha/FixB family protein [Haloferax sp. AB510]
MSDVLAVAEHRRGDLRDVSFELITAGRDLAEKTGGDLHLAVIGGPTGTFAEQLNREGVDTIITIEYGEEFNHDVYTQITEQLYADLEPAILLLPNTVNGLDYAPAVANSLGIDLIPDAVGLDYEDDTLTATREMYGSKVETTVETEAPHVAVSIRDAEWSTTDKPGDAEITSFEADIDESAIRSTVTGFEEVAGGDVDISESDFLVSVGRGIEDEENLELIFDLADAMDATVSSSRPIVDNGWLPKNRQVGQSGKVVTPDVYLAIGISGAVQHVAGMKGSETIVAINNDPNAPIFDIADYGIVGDLFEIVPQLTEQLES